MEPMATVQVVEAEEAGHDHEDYFDFDDLF